MIDHLTNQPEASEPLMGKKRKIRADFRKNRGERTRRSDWTRRFNEEAVRFGPDVEVLTISMDLPFAQKRWCAAAGVERVRTLSDHRNARFGTAYGVLLREVRLLARAIFVVDREGIVRYTQLVSEVSHEPDYEAAQEALKQLT